METLIGIFKKPLVKRLIILAVIAFLLYLMRSMITLFLLTFIFIYLINAAQKFIYRHVHKFIPVKRSFIIVFIYLVATALLATFLWVYIPQIITQSVQVVKLISSTATKLYSGKTTGNAIADEIIKQIRKMDFKSYVENGGKMLVSFLGNLGTLSFYFFLSIILSLFYMLQKSRIYLFMGNFRESKVAWLYEELKYFGLKFSNTFGKVLQTQIVIAFINCLLSMFMLWIMRFPSILGLGVMIFVLGLIPIAGVFVSLLPLSIIAYTVGGWQYILYVLIMIVILHAVESYVLNPKLMSDKTNLPVFFTFLIITVSGHFFGIWGLLVGIPVFCFFLDILDVKTPNIKMPLPSVPKFKPGAKKTTVKKEK